MDSRLTILEELNQISPVVGGIGSTNPYGVPEGYFESFATNLMERIRMSNLDPKQELESLSPLLGSISKQVPYNLPENYFTDLSDQALVGAKAIEFVNEELENLSPLMNSLKLKNVYVVPEGYFDSLSQDILIRARRQQPGKVIAMRPVRKIMRLAVAAILIGVIATGAWFISNPTNGPTVANIENGIQKASDEDILNFIETDDAPITDPVLSIDVEMDESDVKAMLADISDSELEQFANESTDQNNTLSN
ncbi:MAG TPA: hypothetical protein VEV87_02130 [Chitinophagaceae bacterium]|nr:hypothetical protein [Chitinophagaceae bacterium]